MRKYIMMGYLNMWRKIVCFGSVFQYFGNTCYNMHLKMQKLHNKAQFITAGIFETVVYARQDF